MSDPRDRTILVIEDNPVVGTVLQKALGRERREHLRIEVATDGLAGYQAACALRPDLIILDLMMPEYDGRAFLQMYAKGGKLDGIPVLIYSATSEEEIQECVEDFPMVKGSIPKPIAPSKLVGIIREHLRPSERTLPIAGADGAPPAAR